MFSRDSPPPHTPASRRVDGCLIFGSCVLGAIETPGGGSSWPGSVFLRLLCRLLLLWLPDAPFLRGGGRPTRAGLCIGHAPPGSFIGRPLCRLRNDLCSRKIVGGGARPRFPGVSGRGTTGSGDWRPPKAGRSAFSLGVTATAPSALLLFPPLNGGWIFPSCAALLAGACCLAAARPMSFSSGGRSLARILSIVSSRGLFICPPFVLLPLWGEFFQELQRPSLCPLYWTRG